MRSWLNRQGNGVVFLIAFATYLTLGVMIFFVLFGGPVLRHLPGQIGGALALAYFTMLGRGTNP